MAAIGDAYIMYISIREHMIFIEKMTGNAVIHFGKLDILDLVPSFKTQVKANKFIFITLDFKDTY